MASAVVRPLAVTEAFEGAEPILVIAAIGACFYFLGQGFGPFLPGEMALLGKFDR
jgi:hypothetical protein